MRRSTLATTLTVAALALAGCGSYGGGSNSSGASGNTAGSGSDKLTIVSPKNGATVKAPVTLRWTSTVPLGPPATGRDHVHVFVDGQSNDYTVVGGHQFTVKNLTNGKHELDISLQHADHSPVGPEAAITVHVTGASGATGGSSGGSSGGSGGGSGGGYGGGGGGGY